MKTEHIKYSAPKLAVLFTVVALLVGARGEFEVSDAKAFEYLTFFNSWLAGWFTWDVAKAIWRRKAKEIRNDPLV